MSADTPTATTRPLRADARRNREKIVEAARAAFAEDGLEAQMDDIARRAGVGVGTLYRHFPTKDALVRAIVEDHMGKMADMGREILGRETDDPWGAFANFMLECKSRAHSDRTLAEVIATQPPATFADAAEQVGLRAVGGELLDRAKACGAARADADIDDIPVLMCGLGAVLHSWGEDAARRYMDIVLAGLRCPSRTD